MRFIKYILFVFTILVIGCTDLEEISYERIPESKYPENSGQVAGISLEAYTYFSSLVDDEGWWFLAQEVSSDEIVFPTRDSDWDDGGKWRVVHQHTWTDDVEGVNRMWERFYLATSKCNQIIERMRTLPESPNIEVKIKEVETIRSFFYYLLIDNYGDLPYITVSADAPVNPQKDTREAVFDSLTTFLENALPYLKAIDSKTMATRYMAFGLLAKLYLNAEIYSGTPQWEKAGQYIDSVLAGSYTLNTKGDVTSSFSTNNEDNSENIFTIPYDEDDFKGFRLHMRTLHYQHNLTFDMPVGPWNGGCVMFDHFKTYDSNDLRKSWFLYGPQYDSKGGAIIESTTNLPLDINPEIPLIRMTSQNTQVEIKTTGARIAKYEVAKGAKENLSNDFPIFRLSDFYLMKAEVEVRLGRSGDEWINPIRERAGVSTYTNVTLDQILEERGRELFAEGHRRQDLIRFGKFTQSWWAKGDEQGGVAGDPSVEVFPIPKWAKDANPNLE